MSRMRVQMQMQRVPPPLASRPRIVVRRRGGAHRVCQERIDELGVGLAQPDPTVPQLMSDIDELRAQSGLGERLPGWMGTEDIHDDALRCSQAHVTYGARRPRSTRVRSRQACADARRGERERKITARTYAPTHAAKRFHQTVRNIYEW